MAPLKSASRQKKAVQKAALTPPPGKRSRQPKKAPVGAVISWPPDEDRVEEIFVRLSGVMPDPKTELDFVNPYTLVVAVALSAQATDVGVNKATKALFAVADTPQKMLA
ncbi:MAG TPA: endonuclease III, partial [Brevundimonas sp.]